MYVLAFLIGVIAGLRALTAPAAVSWAARLGWLHRTLTASLPIPGWGFLNLVVLRKDLPSPLAPESDEEKDQPVDREKQALAKKTETKQKRSRLTQPWRTWWTTWAR